MHACRKGTRMAVAMCRFAGLQQSAPYVKMTYEYLVGLWTLDNCPEDYLHIQDAEADKRTSQSGCIIKHWGAVQLTTPSATYDRS